MDMNSCNVSMFGKATDTYNVFLVSVDSLLYCIKTGGTIKGIIEKIRQDPTANKKQKLELPVIMWQGTFSHRADSGVQSLSSLMCVDIDHKPAEELTKLRSCLMSEPWVMAIFLSPSGDGLKVIVKTDNFNIDNYKNCYRQLEKMFEDQYGIQPDNKCEAVSQGCFASYDPDVYVNPNVADLHLEYDPAFDTHSEKAIVSGNPVSSYSPRPMSQVDAFLCQLGNGLSDDDIIQIADKRFARYPKRYTDGYRTKSIFVQAGTLCKAGISMEKTLKYLKEHYLPTGYDESKLEYETNRAYDKYAVEFGTERGTYRP